MFIKYSPQRSNNNLRYKFAKDKITATLEIMETEEYAEEIERQVPDGEPVLNEETQELEQRYKLITDTQTKEREVIKESHTEIFDFSKMPDGIMESVETGLPINPVISAKREDGKLYVELLNYIGVDATEEERFPDWKEV